MCFYVGSDLVLVFGQMDEGQQVEEVPSSYRRIAGGEGMPKGDDGDMDDLQR